MRGFVVFGFCKVYNFSFVVGWAHHQKLVATLSYICKPDPKYFQQTGRVIIHMHDEFE